jgi:hypothetical protein
MSSSVRTYWSTEIKNGNQKYQNESHSLLNRRDLFRSSASILQGVQNQMGGNWIIYFIFFRPIMRYLKHLLETFSIVVVVGQVSNLFSSSLLPFLFFCKRTHGKTVSSHTMDQDKRTKRISPNDNDSLRLRHHTSNYDIIHGDHDPVWLWHSTSCLCPEYVRQE